MKEAELRNVATCGLCGRKFGHCGALYFYRIRIERYHVDPVQVKAQTGLEKMIGVQMAQVMGQDRDLAEKTGENEMTICAECSKEIDILLKR